MPPLSPISAINPAFERTASILFRPFRFKTWLKIGFIAWMAGAGGFNFNYNTGSSSGGKAGGDIGNAISSFFHQHMLLIAILTMIFIAIVLIFMYLSCRFRFILFDAVLWRDPQIAKGWKHFRIQANRYFLFLVGFSVVCIMVVALVVGVPMWRAVKSGAFNTDSPFPFLFRYLLPMLLVVLLFVIVAAIVSTLANDFMIPFMALDNISLEEAWGWLRQLMAAEPGSFTGYLGMKLVLSIGGSIAIGVTILLIVLILLIPAIIVIALVAVLLKQGGVEAHGFAVIAAILGVLAAIVLIFFLVMMIGAPLAVFLTSYSLYFLGGRYPRLAELLWPQPPSPVAPPPLAPPPPMPGAAPAT